MTEALLVAKLLPTAYLVFTRWLVRRARVSFRGLPPGEHNFDPLDEDTPLDHLESSQNTQRSARDLLLVTTTHTHTAFTIRGRFADRIALEDEERWTTGRGEREERV